MASAPLPLRGVHIDCRAQMLRFESLREIYRDLSRWGFNTVLFEYEDRFPYRGRLKKIPATDALTPRQVRELNRMAQDLGLQVIPLIQCLGHLEYVLRHATFARHAEPAADPFSQNKDVLYAICPSRREPLSLFREMADQVLELHGDARLFHMGGDEVVLSKHCPRCGPRLKKAGVSAVLMQHYATCADWLNAQRVAPILWGDLVLAHPEHLDALRGKAVIMDWDYWSGQQPRNVANVWGARGVDFHKPRTWPKPLGELFGSYVLTEDGKRARPFPYVRFLRDHGFQVIVAPAARSYGDQFCVPIARHIDNTIGGARTASEAHVLGSVITSWALRRAPWPLTENILLAGAMTMKDAATDRRVIDRAFAKEHFGVNDPALARIPLLLSGIGQEFLYLQSLPRFDARTGRWPSPNYDTIVENARKNPARFRHALARFARDIRQAECLLKRARPRNARQKERVALWRWACKTLAHFAAFGPQLLLEPGEHKRAELEGFQANALRLAKETGELLLRIYTPRTVAEEQQSRFGPHLEFIDRMTLRSRQD